MTEISNNPIDTRRHLNVYKTSTLRRQNRIDVLQTLKQHRDSAGKHPQQTFNHIGTPQEFRSDMRHSYSAEQSQ